MPRALFEKTGNAVWMSHLDLMRLLQRAFQRAGIRLAHSQGFHPRPSLSLALPLSVGVESVCELMDFSLAGEELAPEEIRARLNPALVPGVHVREVYPEGRKIRELALLRCEIVLEYDGGVPEGTVEALRALYAQPRLVVPKKTKEGVQELDIAPMIRSVAVAVLGGQEIKLDAVIHCQNPALNPTLLGTALGLFAMERKPDHSRYRRVEIYDETGTIFR